MPCQICHGLNRFQEHKPPCGYTTGKTVTKLCPCGDIKPCPKCFGFNTSRNIVPKSYKLAAVKFSKAVMKTQTMFKVLDYGSGKWETAANYLLDHTYINVVNRYDPQLPGTEQHLTRDYDLVFLNNVLNVLRTDARRKLVLRQAWDQVKPGGNLIVQIYEGNRSGIGAETRDGYQTNERAAKLWIETLAWQDVNPIPAYEIRGYKRYGNIIIIDKSYTNWNTSSDVNDISKLIYNAEK